MTGPPTRLGRLSRCEPGKEPCARLPVVDLCHFLEAGQRPVDAHDVIFFPRSPGRSTPLAGDATELAAQHLQTKNELVVAVPPGRGWPLSITAALVSKGVFPKLKLVGAFDVPDGRGHILGFVLDPNMRGPGLAARVVAVLRDMTPPERLEWIWSSHVRGSADLAIH